MALKVGTENKRNVIIAGVLFAVAVGLAIYQLTGGPSTPPAPAPSPVQPITVRQAPTAPAIRTTTGGNLVRPGIGPAARQVASSGLDPALHLEKLAMSESIEYAGNGRNIFSAESAPVPIETAAAGARPGPEVAAVNTGPPPPPQPPAIDLKFFGYSANKDGKREAFLLHGDDIFEAAAGEIVNHRYKVVTVDQHSIQITDLSYNNTQTLQLAAN
jgi:hypothetical protein